MKNTSAFGEIAERIQGRQVLIEDGDKYILQNIPVATQLQNTGYEKRTLQIEGEQPVRQSGADAWKGESKEWLLKGQLHEDKRETGRCLERNILAEGNPELPDQQFKDHKYQRL